MLLISIWSITYSYNLKLVKAMTKKEGINACCDAPRIYAPIQKRHVKTKHHNKNLALLILSEL